MSMSNKVRLDGTVGCSPEVREIAKGRKVARFSIATSETFRNSNGEEITDTQWHTVVAWGRTADDVERLIRKGKVVSIEGKLVHRSYEGADGAKRYVTEIVLSDFQVYQQSRPRTMKLEYLKASRSEINESRSNGMAGCLIDEEGAIVAYIPGTTEKASMSATDFLKQLYSAGLLKNTQTN